MDVGKIGAIPAALPQGQTLTDSSHSNERETPHSAVVKRPDGGYRAYVVPSPPGLSASGGSPAEAEGNLSLILDLQA